MNLAAYVALVEAYSYTEVDLPHNISSQEYQPTTLAVPRQAGTHIGPWVDKASIMFLSSMNDSFSSCIYPGSAKAGSSSTSRSCGSGREEWILKEGENARIEPEVSGGLVVKALDYSDKLPQEGLFSVSASTSDKRRLQWRHSVVQSMQARL